jgi:8-amino-7-oxononanoate synthase
LDLVREESWRRDHLRDLVALFCHGAEQLGLPIMASDSAIQPLMVGDARRAVAVSSLLRQRGILVGAIRPPTVPPGTSRLRITLSAAHSREQVQQLLEQLAACWSND